MKHSVKRDDYLHIRGTSHEPDPINSKMCYPARDYGSALKRFSQAGVREQSGSVRSARIAREHQRAMDEWLDSEPGTVKALVLLHKWMSMPTC